MGPEVLLESLQLKGATAGEGIDRLVAIGHHEHVA